MFIPDASWFKPQKGERLQVKLRHHHVVSLAVIVMCLMLKCMQTSKVQIQAHTLVWSLSFAAILLVLVMFTFCGHLVIPFDKNNVPLKNAIYETIDGGLFRKVSNA